MKTRVKCLVWYLADWKHSKDVNYLLYHYCLYLFYLSILMTISSTKLALPYLTSLNVSLIKVNIFSRRKATAYCKHTLVTHVHPWFLKITCSDKYYCMKNCLLAERKWKAFHSTSTFPSISAAFLFWKMSSELYNEVFYLNKVGFSGVSLEDWRYCE